MTYIKDIQQSVWRILCALNQDKCSTSVGSFDRYYWAWKKRDFQDSTLSYAALPLIKGLERTGSSISALKVLDAAVQNILKIQKKDGSFDQCYPNENHPKVGLDFSSVLYEFLRRTNQRICEKAYRSLIEYSLSSEEEYADICNHLAHHAYEYLLAYSYFKDGRYYKAAVNNIHVIVELTHPTEGWHKEYLGGDPGYQTRTLRYLTKCLDYLKDKDRIKCEDLCRLSARFINATVMPDGTLYGAFGSRNTAIIYPSGIEYMARRYPKDYGNLTLRVRKAIETGLTIQPMYLEFDNFIRLFDDYLDAQVQEDSFKDEHLSSASYKDDYTLDDYGLIMMNKGSSKIYIHAKFGGACAIYNDDKCIYRDAGLLVKDVKGKYYGSKNLLTKSSLERRHDEKIRISTKLFESIHQDITPYKLLMLRVLNLTILRMKFLADLFRKYVVGNVIVGSQKRTKGVLKRDININDGFVKISDHLCLKVNPAKIWRAVNLNLFHMASSRYLNPVEAGFQEYKELEHNGESEALFVNTISLK